MEKVPVIDIPDALPHVRAVYLVGKEVLGLDLVNDLQLLAYRLEHGSSATAEQDPAYPEVQTVYQVGGYYVGISELGALVLARGLNSLPPSKRKKKAAGPGSRKARGRDTPPAEGEKHDAHCSE